MEKILSICMMVRDEENNLYRCLNSLSILINDLRCELIIVDTGSIDGTVSIAKQFTQNIYFKKWNNDFSEIRNYSISLAKGKWIFIIDADEELLTPELIWKAIEKAEDEKCNTIAVEVRNLQDLNKTDLYVLNISPRIFRNTGKFGYYGSVHNQPKFEQPILVTDIVLNHYGYLTSDRELVEKKFKRTVSIIKSELEKNPDDIYYQYQLGVSYDFYGDRRQASIEFDKAYTLLSTQPIEVKKGYILVYCIYARTLLSLGENYKAIKIASEGISLVPDYVDLYYILGYAYMRIGNFEDGLKTLKKYLKLAENIEELSIYEDPKVIFYHVSPMHINFVLKDISEYYLAENDLENAIYYIEKIKDNDIKVRLEVDYFFKKRDFGQLYKMYKNLDEKLKELVSEKIENELIENSVFKTDLYKTFANSNDMYGEYCKLMISETSDDFHILERILEKEVDKLPLYFFKVLNKIKNEDNIIIILRKFDSDNKLINMISYLLSTSILKEEKILYIIDRIKESSDLRDIKLFICMTNYLLKWLVYTKKEIKEKEIDLFFQYLERGRIYIFNTLETRNMKNDLKLLPNDETKIFWLYDRFIYFLEKGDLKSGLKFLGEIVKIEPAFSVYVKHILSSI
ncbi:glycosyl transferase family 2 [Caldicellulosiruptor acetigenus I77R1B]|uniref:Glycosyl transferase family 2 n=1 Tax=Caldicellulosiruptor acetigenus (strain ATCC 700853 / DSM 12137 / I77R1B) TaxID=632335 RepID=E4SAE2_CALA7|nr:glycosyltransferase family 2 protein [Caldicellulosiruptor acetigenus]ADQ41167.1 glycosyl transferase family 2 [Caldicellulosiruptor acetigenus I77R1B]